jgi:hypothetical protein
VFSDVGRKKKILLEEVCAFDAIEEERTLGDKERRKNEEVVNELEIHSHGGGEMEQKSRALWLRDGDKCKKFFHKEATSNRRKNSLLIDGTLLTTGRRSASTLSDFIKS